MTGHHCLMGGPTDSGEETGPSPFCPTLTTDRLVLRPFRDDDVDDLFAVLDTAEVQRWLHLTERYGRDDAWHLMAMFMGQWVLRGPKVH